MCRVENVWVVTEERNPSIESVSSKCSVLDTRRAIKHEKASGIIISAVGYAPFRAVLPVEDSPAKSQSFWIRDMNLSELYRKTQLLRMSYKNHNMAPYIDQCAPRFSQLQRAGTEAAISEGHKAPMFLALVDPTCYLESSTTALRAKMPNELSWD